MTLVPMGRLLRDALAGGYAVPSFCVWNAESMACVLRVAARLRAPVIMMNGPGEFDLLSPEQLGPIARTMAAGHDQPVALHLDHGDSHARVEACLAAGYTSVMLDYSTRPYPENAAAVRRVVEMARPFAATVEGELGVVGKTDDATVEGGDGGGLTDPAEAAEYVAETGIDALAVGIGNAHGLYTSLPQLDFDRLAAIRRAVDVPLVLHGGSGTPPDDLRRAISSGIAKVNIATESVVAVTTSLREQAEAGRNRWWPMALSEAYAAMDAVVEKWIRAAGAEGKAA